MVGNPLAKHAGLTNPALDLEAVGFRAQGSGHGRASFVGYLVCFQCRILTTSPVDKQKLQWRIQ